MDYSQVPDWPIRYVRRIGRPSHSGPQAQRSPLATELTSHRSFYDVHLHLHEMNVRSCTRRMHVHPKCVPANVQAASDSQANARNCLPGHKARPSGRHPVTPRPDHEDASVHAHCERVGYFGHGPRHMACMHDVQQLPVRGSHTRTIRTTLAAARRGWPSTVTEYTALTPLWWP